MRGYCKVSPRLWTGSLGKRLRGDAYAQALASYLVSSPHANMVGLYYLPIGYISLDLGWTSKASLKALRRLVKEGFIRYDEKNERVWVVQHARIEFGDGLKLGDNRIKGIANLLADHANSFLVREFLTSYGVQYHVSFEDLQSLPEGASEGLRNQEQEQEQEQEGPTVLVSISPPLAEETPKPPPEVVAREELRWRVGQVWQAHLAARRAFFERETGVSPSQLPTFDHDDIEAPIRDALQRFDGDLMAPDQRDRWKRESRVRASGIGIFYDSWMTGNSPENNTSNGGKRYLEPWRPWKAQRGKGHPVLRFAELYFTARDKSEARAS